MTRRPPVILEEVGEAILALRESDKEVSLRNIRRKTGGKNNTIMRLKAEWLDLELNEKAAPEISEELLKNLKTGIGKSIRAETDQLKQSLDAAREQRAEALDLLDEAETNIETAREVAQVKVEALNETIKGLQLTVADTEKQLKDANKQRNELKVDNQDRHKEILRLSKDLAAAKAASDLLNRQYQELISGSMVETVVRKVMDEERSAQQ